MKKGCLVCLLMFLTSGVLIAQQVYIDFEQVALVELTYKSGRIDMKSKNPAPDSVNGSERCARYIRNSKESFDNIKLQLQNKLNNIESFATYDPGAQKIRMKVFTSASPGTLIEIQLAKNSGLNYPMSVHSQYQAYTTKQNQWEELEFSFSVIPKGTMVKANDVNQVNILFAPNSKNNDKFYFDDIYGPVVKKDETITKGKKKI